MGHETSPDSLKNTSTNIARLEDVIEHCEGRKKYHAQTMSPSDGADIRWYFCEVPLTVNELAAAVPRTEIVGKSDYFRFGMRDSLAIEASFLQGEDELLSYWWREYAECYEAPKGLSKTHVDFSPSSAEGTYVDGIYPTEEERLGVPVKGGLYEVDLVKRQCFPVYWGGENRRVLRGHWFARKGGLDWLPLREDVSEQLEYAYRCRVWHRRTFQPSGLFAARIDLQGSTPGLHALFTGEDDSWEAWLSIDAFSFLGGVNPHGNTVKLRRGYSTPHSVKPSQDELRQRKEEEMDDYCSQVPVKHLIFMVHGIGQRLERSNLIDDVGTFRNITTRLAELHLTPYQRLTQRVLFIPCQWRRDLRLSGEAAVEKITLDGVRGLRVMLSATVHDVLYYMSPIYCQDIVNSVTNQLNMLYLKFIKRNPGYDGKVSLYAHSLGSVLSYDILCHQGNLSSPFAMDSVYKYLEDDNRNAGIFSNLSVQKVDSREERTLTSATSYDRMEVLDAAPSAKFSAVSGDCFEAVSREVESDTLLGEVIDTTEGCSSGNFAHVVVGDTVSMSELLREIDALKAKVTELELKCAAKEGGGGSMNDDMAEQKHDIVSPLSVCQRSYTPYIKYQKLEFEVDTFFAVGSPLGVFLALRNVRIGIGMGKEYWSGENIDEEMPACGKMFNIFHPFDPVAYRLEPLICKEYLGKRPVFVPYHKGGKRLHISIQDFTDEISARSGAVILRLKSMREKILTTCQARELDDSEDADAAISEEKSYGSIMMKRLTGEEDGRIDYMLQDKTFQHAYISAIGSHTNYWRDYDTALFILKHLYRDIPAQKPHSSVPSPLVHPGNADDEAYPLLSATTSSAGFQKHPVAHSL